MDDLISRKAAIDALGERPMVWVESDYELGARNQYDADVLALETVPSAQPMRKRGKWIRKPSPDKYHCGYVICPYCKGEYVESDGDIFCPICGSYNG